MSAIEALPRAKFSICQYASRLVDTHARYAPTWLHRPSGMISGCQPHLVQALEAEKIGLDRARAEARVRAREEAESQTTAAAKERDGSGNFFGGDGARLPPGPADEDSCLRSATMKYIRGSIGAGRLYEEMVAVRGRVEEAVIAKVARGMPEDKAWALMDAHRKWRHEERLKKKRLRASRRAGATARRKTKKEDASAESEGGDDRLVYRSSTIGPSVSVEGCSILRIVSAKIGSITLRTPVHPFRVYFGHKEDAEQLSKPNAMQYPSYKETRELLPARRCRRCTASRHALDQRKFPSLSSPPPASAGARPQFGGLGFFLGSLIRLVQSASGSGADPGSEPGGGKVQGRSP